MIHKKRPPPSFLRRRESSIQEGWRKTFWIPACAGMTAAGKFVQ